MSDIVSGTISSLTLTGNQCIVVVNDASGRAQPPQTLKNSNGNYNALISALLLASSSKYPVELHTDNAGIEWVVVKVAEN